MATGSDLKFLSNYEVAPQNSQLNDFLEEMEQCNADNVYKELVDKVLAKYSGEYSEENAHYVRNVLIEFFAKTSSRKNLRKYIYEKLNTVTIENTTLFENVVNSMTNEIQENINNLNIFKITQCCRMLNFLTVFMQNFSNNSKYDYLLEKVFPFYLCIMEVYTSQLFNSKFCKDGCVGKNILDYDDCYTVLCMTLTQLAAALAKCEEVNLKCYAVKMVILTHEILQCHSQLKFEAISKCTIVLAYFSSFVPKEETEFLKYKEYPILDFVDNENDYSLILKSKKLSNVFINDRMKVVLNLAVYTTINQNQLLEIKIDGRPLLEVIYFNIIDLGMKMTSFPDQIIPISRTVDAMAKNLSSLENLKEIFNQGFIFAWGHLDHFVEHVVISTRSFLKSLVEEGCRRSVRHDDYYLKKFFQDLNSMSVFSKVRLNALLSVSKILESNIILINSPQVQHHLLTLATSSSDRDLAGQVYIQMMTPNLNVLQEKDIIKIWLKPVLSILRQPNIKYYNVLEEIITNAFKSRPEIFPLLFTSRTSTNNENVIILKCVHFARINGITLADGEEYWRKLLSKSKLEVFMIHQDDEVRINALRVIAECQKTTEEFTEWELKYLIRYFQCNVATQTAAIRNKIITYYKKIIARHQVTYSILMKKLSNSREFDCDEEKSQCKLTIQEYKNFLNHFLQLLIFYLSPDANYSRRSICLDLLIFIHQFICQEQWQKLFQRDDVNNLKRLLYDSYESNKSMAVELLKTLPPSEIGFNNETNSNDYFKKCMRMACDIRPSQSVSASYMFQVFLQSEYAFKSRGEDSSDVTNTKQCFLMLSMIEQIEKMFDISRGDVVKAAKSTPFHGLLLSIRHLLRKRDVHEDNMVFSYFFEHLATLCLKLKDHIMPVVCNTSPEGHLPNGDDTDDFLEYDQSSKAQQILVYSWKTMKEIMLLLAEIIRQTVFLENEGEMLEVELLQKITDFFMDVFITTKHRGVFEQAHVAFTTVCKSFCSSNNQIFNNLPVKCLNEAVSLCTGQKIDGRLCATRRSAGLPFLILSILPALTDTTRDIIRRTMEPLLQTSVSDNDELRMHCLNVLRFIFKNSKLADHITNFVDRGAIAALKGFNSKTWGVRNSATLLLSTIIVRIFGMPKTAESDQCEENRLTLAVFYMRYKNLFEFLLEVVERDCGKFDSLLLHPALLILSRLYPSHNDSVNEQVKKHIPFINICMKNPSYRTRDLAARASVSLISENYLMTQLGDNFDRIGCKGLEDTECHGLLLQIRHIFYTTTFEVLPISDYLEKSMYLLGEAGKRHSHLTVTLYTDIIFILLTKYRNYEDLDLLKKLVGILKRQEIIGEQNKLTTCQTSYNWSHFQLLLFILLNKFQHVPETFPIIAKILVRALYESDSEVKKKCLEFLIYLNQQISDDEFKEHPLILSGDIEISPQIKVLTHSLDNQTKKEVLTYIHSYLIIFFYTELSAQFLKKDDDYYVLVFLLLRFYPCFFEDLRTNQGQQNILEWFLSMTKRCKEEITSAIISCFKTFMVALKSEELGQMNYSNLIGLLMESAAPTAADYRRLAVAQFLVSSQVLFKRHIFTEYEQYNILNVVMVLLEDDEAIVRNTMSTFATKPYSWPVVPSEAMSTILVSSVSQFRNDMAISFLASWALRRLPEVSRDVSEVYERGEFNIFSENIPVTFAASEVLHALLWNLGDVLSYEDKTIFLEEQTLLVTTLVLNSLIKIPSPMMDKQTKRTVICVFKCISRFIEDSTIGNDFHDNFRKFFITKILKFLKSSLKTDYYSTKAFLTYLYNPLLNMHFRFPCQ